MEESSRKTNIFISYSRKDKLFVRKLNDALDALGVDAWVDWEGIELASDWMARITAADGRTGAGWIEWNQPPTGTRLPPNDVT